MERQLEAATETSEGLAPACPISEQEKTSVWGASQDRPFSSSLRLACAAPAKATCCHAVSGHREHTVCAQSLTRKGLFVLQSSQEHVLQRESLQFNSREIGFVR